MNGRTAIPGIPDSREIHQKWNHNWATAEGSSELPFNRDSMQLYSQPLDIRYPGAYEPGQRTTGYGDASFRTSPIYTRDKPFSKASQLPRDSSRPTETCHGVTLVIQYADYAGRIQKKQSKIPYNGILDIRSPFHKDVAFPLTNRTNPQSSST